jgi:alcohol dehydrogenase, propanol-preferring
MAALDRGGILAIAGIYLSRISHLDYERDLFYERELRSVTANTRAYTVGFKLGEANRALNMRKHDELRSAAVLHIS